MVRKSLLKCCEFLAGVLTRFFHYFSCCLQLDIHFENKVLRLASVNCEAEILLKNVLQKKSDSLNLTSTTHHKLQPTKIGETHQYFACILRYHGDEGKLNLIDLL